MKILLTVLLLLSPVLAQQRRELNSDPVVVAKLEENLSSGKNYLVLKIALYNTSGLNIKAVFFDIAIDDVRRGADAIDRIRGLVGNPKLGKVILKPNERKEFDCEFIGYYLPSGWAVDAKGLRLNNVVFDDGSIWINPDVIEKPK